VHSRKDLRDFLRFPWKVQAHDPAWVPPLLIDQKSRFSPKYPFYEHGEVESYLARASDGEPLGRVSAVVNRLHNDYHKDKVGFFGFFECVNDPDVARALLDHAGVFLRERGFTSVRGPMNFSVNEEAGMLIEGFDTPPAIMMTHNPPYYNDLMEACGYVKAKDLLAYEMFEGDLTERVVRIGQKLEDRLKLRIREFDPKDFWGEVAKVLDIYNEAWGDNWGFVPMTDRELRLMAQTLKLVYEPRMILFAENEQGKAVGFSLALPDIHYIFKKMNGRLLPTGIFKLLFGLRSIHRARVLLMGVRPEYRGHGIDTVFYYRTYKVGTALGYSWGEFSWILEDNKMMNAALVTMGSKPYKKWRIWEKLL
jgi:GNAT superfamily N-acetyltransferase